MDLTGGTKRIAVDWRSGSLSELLSALEAAHPRLVLRIRDETGALRRYVNVYLDGTDVRSLGGAEAVIHDGAELTVLPSVAGGSSATEVSGGLCPDIPMQHN